LSAPSPHRRPALEVAGVGVLVGVVLIAVPLLLPRATTVALNLRTPVNVKMGMVWAFTIGGVAATLPRSGTRGPDWWGAWGRSLSGSRSGSAGATGWI
jgi:hypothetical protein